jgi:hypothetical protein
VGNGNSIRAIGTTNYNKFVNQVMTESGVDCQIFHLNGSTEDFYDPYRNNPVSLATPDYANFEKVLVPLLFTQSGIKPLTSINMSRRYVELFDEFKQSDAVIVCGFGFNGDDGHVNCLFRQLIEDEGKDVVVLHYGGGTATDLRETYRRKLRLYNATNLHVLTIDVNRNINGRPWHEIIAQGNFTL